MMGKQMVKAVINDYENDRDIDQINIYNKPDKEEVSKNWADGDKQDSLCPY